MKCSCRSVPVPLAGPDALLKLLIHIWGADALRCRNEVYSRSCVFPWIWWNLSLLVEPEVMTLSEEWSTPSQGKGSFLKTRQLWELQASRKRDEKENWEFISFFIKGCAMGEVRDGFDMRSYLSKVMSEIEVFSTRRGVGAVSQWIESFSFGKVPQVHDTSLLSIICSSFC